VHEHRLVLADAMGAVGRLVLDNLRRLAARLGGQRFWPPGFPGSEIGACGSTHAPGVTAAEARASARAANS